MAYEITYFAVSQYGKYSMPNLSNAIGGAEYDSRTEVHKAMKEKGVSSYTVIVCCSVIDDSGEYAIDFGYGLTVKQAKANVLPRYGLK